MMSLGRQMLLLWRISVYGPIFWRERERENYDYERVSVLRWVSIKYFPKIKQLSNYYLRKYVLARCIVLGIQIMLQSWEVNGQCTMSWETAIAQTEV